MSRSLRCPQCGKLQHVGLPRFPILNYLLLVGTVLVYFVWSSYGAVSREVTIAFYGIVGIFGFLAMRDRMKAIRAHHRLKSHPKCRHCEFDLL